MTVTKYNKNKAQKTEIGKNFTLNLKYFRNRKGWTQKDLADKLGNSQQAIWFWEMGGKSPRLQDLDAVCDALDVSLIELFGLQEDAFNFTQKNPQYAPPKKSISTTPASNEDIPTFAEALQKKAPMPSAI